MTQTNDFLIVPNEAAEKNESPAHSNMLASMVWPTSSMIAMAGRLAPKSSMSECKGHNLYCIKRHVVGHWHQVYITGYYFDFIGTTCGGMLDDLWLSSGTCPMPMYFCGCNWHHLPAKTLMCSTPSANGFACSVSSGLYPTCLRQLLSFE